MDWLPKESIAPLVTGIFLLVTGAIALFSNHRNMRNGARESRAPDVQEMWAQQEADRRQRHLVEDMWYNLRNAFRSYYRRQLAGGSKELSAKEQAAIDAELPKTD